MSASNQDLASLIEPVARRLFGQPNASLSTRTELRFGTHGSLAVVIAGEKQGTWFDHEAGQGGGVLDLVQTQKQLANGEALNWLRAERLLPTREEPTRKDGQIAASYNYHDHHGTLVFQVVRKVPKAFVQRRPNGNGGWIWNLNGVERVPYRLPELLRAAPLTPVFICEGEKDCDALHERCLVATTNPEGAGKWQPDMSAHLLGRDVVILPDNDQAGEQHAKDVAGKLHGIARSIRILRLPGLPAKGDVVDWLACGGTADDLERLAAEAPTYEPERKPNGQDWHGDAGETGQRTQDKPQTCIIRVIYPTGLACVPVPPRLWIVQDWLPIGTVTGNYGDGGVGKTLLSQVLQTSCATHIPWVGQVALQCKSLGLYCEDSEEELHRRQDDINAVFGLTYSHLADMRWISGVGDDWTLVNFTADGRMQTTERWNSLVHEVKACGARLVLLDTAADLFGGNENDRGQVRRFISLLAGLARDIDGAVLLNCHPSRSGLASGNLDGGSTAWSNSFRSRWSLARPEGEDVPADTPDRLLTRRKANYANGGDIIRLRWTKGAFVPQSLEGGVSGIVNRAATEAVFLTLLDRAETAQTRVSDSKNAANYAPRVFAQRPDSEGYSRKDFEKSMAALFAGKRIVMQSYGRPGDYRQRIVRAPQEQDG
jgi:RecA-family ATPase